ncbi:hypothetical protein Riv7116_5181 [Rivularia sp. PCC 7116]|uniref:hypothetical protein n=1 Tax=Rivularia sp. PCC 7116 TaxID=373994 RepID=UPI00029F177C|nr:hypothetical protein [Rivularia sp. PCC 7116]AFY57577.1 hypothetical protein Riv7116_5181 [Rivularia sp. PCC 7116]
MNDFIATMTARAIGGIPVVEPLMHSMYLNLPVMPGDYTEDASPEPEPSTFIDDEPDLNFMSLVPSKGLSSAMPRLNEGSLGVESQYVESELRQVGDDGETIKEDNSLESGFYDSNAEGRKVERKGTQSFLSGLNNSDFSGETEIIPQVNHLQPISQSVEADVELDLNTSTSESELKQVSEAGETIKQDNSLESGFYDSNAEGRKGKREGTRRFLTTSNNSDVSRETEVSPNIVPQVNHLNAASQSVEADVELDLNTSTSESELKQVSEAGETIKQDNSLELGFYDSNAEGRKGERKVTRRFLSGLNNSDVSRETEVSPNIVPQVNHLNAASQFVEADVELSFNTSIPKSELRQVSEEIEFPNADDGETIISVETPKEDSSTTATSSNNINSERDILPNIVPQVNHLQPISQSVEADVELDFNISIPKSESYQNSDNTRKQLPEQFTNTQNQPSEKVAGVDKLDISSVENPSPNKITSKQQTKKYDGVNKNIAPKTVKPNLKQQALAPQVNRVETTKFSVKPDIQLNTAQLNLQNPLQQQRIEKTNTGETIKAQTGESILASNSKSQTPVSTPQQSIRLNLVNDEHTNTDFVEKPEIQNSISRVEPDINKHNSVISPREDLVKNASSIHTQIETRRHQAEPQPSPTIKVTIGRIEVRKSQPEASAKAQTRKSTKKSPALSLSDYLKQRDGK